MKNKTKKVFLLTKYNLIHKFSYQIKQFITLFPFQSI